MSSMQRKTIASVLAILAFSPSLAQAQDDQMMGEDGRQWDHARVQLATLPPGNMVQAIERWKLLSRSDGFLFSDYSDSCWPTRTCPNRTECAPSPKRRWNAIRPNRARL